MIRRTDIVPNGLIGYADALPPARRTPAAYRHLVRQMMAGRLPLRHARCGHNMILNEGLEQWWRSLALADSDSLEYWNGAPIGAWGIGTGTTAPQPDDEALETPVTFLATFLKDHLLGQYRAEDVAVFVFWLPEELGNGNAISEAALRFYDRRSQGAGSASRQPTLNRWVFPALPSKTDKDILVGMVTIRFNPANTDSFVWTPFGKRFVISKLVDTSLYGQLDEYGVGSSSAEPADEDQLAAETHAAAAACVYSPTHQRVEITPASRPTGTQTGSPVAEFGARASAEDKYLYRTTFGGLAPGGGQALQINDYWTFYDRIQGLPDLGTYAGPRYAGTLAEEGNSGSSWSNYAYAGADDGRQTSITLSSGLQTDFIVASDFGFSIPGSATIGDIVVEVKRLASHQEDFQTGFVDQHVELSLDSGATSALTNEAVTTESWLPVWHLATYTFDGSSLTPAQVNAASFAARVAAENNHTAAITANVEFVRVTIFYAP